MKSGRITIALLFVTALLAGCASTQVTQQTPIQQMGLPRPNTIYVYNFIASQDDIPSDTPILSNLSERLMPASAEEEDTGRQLGAAISRDLTADINTMGMYAVQAGPSSTPQVGDGVIRAISLRPRAAAWAGVSCLVSARELPGWKRSSKAMQ